MPPAGEPEHTVPWGIASAVTLLFILIIAAGALFYSSQEQQIQDSVSSELTSITLLKVEQIAAWRDERLGDAAVLSQNPILTEEIKHYLASPDPARQQKILTLFRQINTSYHYRNVQLVDPEGHVKVSLDPSDTAIGPGLAQLLAESFATQNATLTDLMAGTSNGSPQMYAISPLLVTDNGRTSIVGAVILTIDPTADLYPLIRSWPVPSGSAETLLVEREGDHVLYLNDLRYQQNTALNLTVPLSRTDLPAVMAVLGTSGAFTGRDYRGIEVISALKPIPGSPWFMVAKVDREEAYSSWRNSSGLIITLVAGTLLGAVIIAGLLWQRRQKYYYRSLYATEAAQRKEEEKNRERLEVLLKLGGMETAGEQELADFVLDAGCRLTDSPLAFIGMMSPDESVFDITAWSKSAMKDCLVAASPIHFPVAKAGIWAEAIRQRKPLIVNDYAAPHPGKKCLPKGHVPLTRFASVPIFEGQRIVMVCAVANKVTEYKDLDVDNLALLMQGVWSHIRKRKADDALRQKTTDLEAAFEEITATDEELRTNYEEIAETQRALAESERKYRNLYHYAQVGLFETSFKDGKVVACNQRYADLAGFLSVEEAIGKDILGFYVNPEDRTEVGRILREQGLIENHVVKFRNRRTGKLFWGSFSARFNYEQEVAEGTIIDITVQKEAEQALRDTEERFRTLVEQLPLGIAMTKRDAGGESILYYNQTFTDMTGYTLTTTPTLDEWVLQAYPDPEYRQQILTRIIEIYCEAGRDITSGTYETRVTCHDGTVKEIEFRYTDLKVFGFWTLNDVTDRKRAEEKIRISELRYRRLFESAKDGILILNRDTGEIIDANPFIEKLLGYAPKDLLGKHLWDIGLFKDQLLSKVAFEDLQAKEYLRYEDLPLETLDGKRKEVEFVSNVYPVDAKTSVIQCNIRDITERKTAEEEIKSANAFLDMIIDMSPFAMWISDKEGTVTRVNRSLCQTINLAPEEIVGKYNVLKDTNLEIQGVMPGVSAVFDTHTPARFSILWKAADAGDVDFKGGCDMFIDVSLFPILNARGELTNVVCQWVDVTERKAAEDALQESNEYLNNLFDYANAPIIVWDPQFRITRFNHAFENLTGRTGEEVLGKHIEILFPEASREASLEHIRRAVSGERWETVEIPILHVSGRTRIVLWNSANIVDPHGTFISTIAQGYDITERKAAADALRQSEEKYRVLFTRMTEGSALHEMVYDPAGNPVDYRILDVNPAFESVLGIRREGVVGKTSREAYGVDTPPYLDTYARVASTGQPALFEEYFAQMQKHFSISVYSPEKGRFATVFEDITDRRRAEQLREQLFRELEQKNAELERFTYTVSHDLKSPLITIKGFAGLLEDDALSGDQVQLKKDISRITTAANTMQELLADVLELSRIGKVIFPPEKTSFGIIAREAVDLLAGPLADRGVWVDMAPDLPVVSVDHARVREALVNLVENAIKFLGSQQNPVIRIGVEMEGVTPVFFVQDNGIGIDPRYLERIFNLFERLDTSTPGTGIGLPIVRRIIEVHGGKIWAESEGPGKGTTFRFTLPGGIDGGDDSA